jgi:antitoxin ParD1/3/4
MTATSMSLGPYWENFLKELVESGRCGSQGEAIRDALRTLEARDRKLDDLRAHLEESRAEAARGEFVDATPESIIAEARAGRV